MVYLVEYKNLNKVPTKTKIMCLEPREDEKFESFPPLILSPFVKSLVRQKRTTQAATELSRLAKSEERKTYLTKLKKTDEDVILVSWESIASPITKLRKDLLAKWKVPYDTIA